MTPRLRKTLKRGAVFCVVFVVVGLILNSVLNRGVCAFYGWQTETETKYRPIVGCLGKVGERWIPIDKMRVID